MFRRLASFTTCFSIIFCLFLIIAARAETDPILAEIGDYKITLKDLEKKIRSIQEGIDKGYLKLDREELLLEMIRLEVFAKEAVALGLDKDQKVQARVRDFKNKILAEKELQKEDQEVQAQIEVFRKYTLASECLQTEVNDKISVDDKEVLQFFKRNRSKYVAPEKIKARMIYIGATTEQQIDEARNKAERLLERLKSGADFSALAREFSDDRLSKDNGGDLGYFTRGRLVPELEEPVFNLREGELSPVLQSPGGFNIFKLEDRIERRLLEYDEAREQSAKDLKAIKGKKLYKSFEKKILKKYDVKVYKQNIPSTPSSSAS